MTDAWLAVEDDKILDFGTGSVPAELMQDAKVIDTKGAFVMPRFCDSHTHLVRAGSREQEFEDKLQGLSYAEIAAAAVASSILPTVSTRRARRTSSSRPCAVPRRSAKGHGLCGDQVGYGLTTEDELKILRVAQRVKAHSPLRIVTTFLGAHAVGRAYKGRQSEYVDLVINEMMPRVAAEGLADFVDVFCDEGFFTPRRPTASSRLARNMA